LTLPQEIPWAIKVYALDVVHMHIQSWIPLEHQRY